MKCCVCGRPADLRYKFDLKNEAGYRIKAYFCEHEGRGVMAHAATGKVNLKNMKWKYMEVFDPKGAPMDPEEFGRKLEEEEQNGKD